MTAVIILLVVISIAFLPLILNALIQWSHRKDYLDVIPWIPFIAITYLLRAIRFYVAMPYAALKYSRPLPLFYLLIVGVKIISMMILIPEYGLIGLLVSIWLGYAVETVVLFLGIKAQFKMEFNSWKLIFAPLLLAVLIVVVETAFGAIAPFLIHSGYIVFAIGLLSWVYRNELKGINLSKFIR